MVEKQRNSQTFFDEGKVAPPLHYYAPGVWLIKVNAAPAPCSLMQYLAHPRPHVPKIIRE